MSTQRTAAASELVVLIDASAAAAIAPFAVGDVVEWQLFWGPGPSS